MNKSYTFIGKYDATLHDVLQCTLHSDSYKTLIQKLDYKLSLYIYNIYNNINTNMNDENNNQIIVMMLLIIVTMMIIISWMYKVAPFRKPKVLHSNAGRPGRTS